MRKIKKTSLIFFFSVLGFFILFNNLSSQQTEEELFEKALYVEEAQGDLQKAVELYEQILKLFPENREISAKAQLHIGICYEKLGLQEAPKAFQKVLENFSEQKDEVKIAKEKLSFQREVRSVIDRTNKDLSVRRVWAGSGVDVIAGISPDGRFLAYTDWNTGDLAIRELLTGKNRRITDKGPWAKSREFGMFPKWSQDGKLIAFLWYNPDGHRFELHLVGVEKPQHRVLIENKNKEYVSIVPYDWHPDGKQILTGCFKGNRILDLGFFSIADNIFRVIKTFKGDMSQAFPWDFVISPDGRNIAYDYNSEPDSKKRDIFLLSGDGANEQKLFDHPASAFVCDWSSDGQHILFGSDRTGDLGLWMVTVEGRKVQDSPSLIKSDMGMFTPIGCTQLDQFYYGYYKEGRDIFLAEIDPKTGQFLAPPKLQVQLYEGCNAVPEFSPDGKSFTYISSRISSAEVKNFLCVYSLENNEIQELDPGFERFNIWSFPQWRPDGRAISLAGGNRSDQFGIHQIEIESEKSSPLVLAPENETIYSHRWAIDGQSLYYTKGVRGKATSIYTYDLKSGQEKKLPGSPDDAFDIEISPDGKWLAFSGRKNKRSLRIIPTAGGDPEELYAFKVMGEYTISLAWSPDGKYIYFSSKSNPDDSEWEMWRFSLDDRQAQEINFNTKAFRYPSIHPDGRHMIFSTEEDVLEKSEVWVLENFLPDKK